MKVVNSILSFISIIIFLAIGVLLMAYAAHLKGVVNLAEQLVYLKELPNLWIISGLMGILVVLIGVSIIKITIGRLQREKTIAYENPEGQVIISLSAIEDFIKRIVRQIIEIKDLRCNVIATKKGINISAKVTLWSDANIPDVTEKIQSLIKSRVQEMLGIEETIVVSVHITKIAHKEAPKTLPEKTQEPAGFKGAIEYKIKTGKAKKS